MIFANGVPVTWSQVMSCSTWKRKRLPIRRCGMPFRGRDRRLETPRCAAITDVEQCVAKQMAGLALGVGS